MNLKPLHRLPLAIVVMFLFTGYAVASGPAILTDYHQPAGLHAPVVLAAISADGVLHTQVIDTAQSKGSVGDAFRIASVTKTFVAATVLRLVEQGKVDLEAGIAAYVDPELIRMLKDDGYATEHMTVRHLLSHSAGLNDHAQSPQFIEVWKNNPQTHWQRRDHIEKLIEWTEPVGAPGERFAYSDSGYLLLGDLIERVTGKSLASAVRMELDFDSLNLDTTWWEQVEPAAARRAHQFFENDDTHDWDASLDLYGGGGLVTTVPDMARFYHALFAGRVFDRKETMERMLSANDLPADSAYRLGIFETNFDGRSIYWHSGFWGTYVAHDPTTGTTFAAAGYDKRDYLQLIDMGKACFEHAASR